MDGTPFMLEFDTPDGLKPEQASTVHVLDVASSYLKLLVALAEEQEAELELEGVEVVDKCLAVSARVSNELLARELAGRANACIQRPEEAPKGLLMLAKAARASLAQMPAHYRVRNIVGDWSTPVETAARSTPVKAWETTTLRVTPIRIGGRSPTVRLESPSEAEPFTVAVGRDQDRALATHLYAEVEAELRLLRNAITDEIEGGELIVFPLEGGDADAAWRRWAQEQPLPSVEDVLAERNEDGS